MRSKLVLTLVPVGLLLAGVMPAASGQAFANDHLAVSSPMRAYSDTKRFTATLDVVAAFNQIGSHAAQMRALMPRADADAFDAVMTDLMGALAALPGIAVRDSGRTDLIKPRNPRPDRLPQIRPELVGLAYFFGRLEVASSTPADRKLFAAAGKQAHRMLAGIQDALPTLDAPPARRSDIGSRTGE